MKPFKKLSSFGAALLLASSAGSIYANESDMNQVRSQERTRTELNSPQPGGDLTQSRNREQHSAMNQKQSQQQNQYKYRNQYRNKESHSGANSRHAMNTTNPYRDGSATGSMQRSAATGSHSAASGTHSTASGSMSRQNTAGQSMGGGRR